MAETVSAEERYRQAQERVDEARQRRAEASERARKADDPVSVAIEVRRFMDTMAESMDFDANAELAARADREKAIRDRLEAMQRSGIADVIDAAIANAITTEAETRTPALDIVSAWWGWAGDREHPGRPRTLVLLGDVGLGKTVAAAWAIAHHGGGRYVSADELTRAWVAHTRTDERGFANQDTRDPWPAIVSAGLLVVDEITAARNADAERDALAELVDKRRGGKLTLLMGNASAEKVRSRLDQRTIDRINVGPVRRLEGSSMRPNRGKL